MGARQDQRSQAPLKAAQSLVLERAQMAEEVVCQPVRQNHALGVRNEHNHPAYNEVLQCGTVDHTLPLEERVVRRSVEATVVSV